MRLLPAIVLPGLLLISGLSCVARPSSQGTTVVFEGVSVIPMDRERVLSNQTVVVRDGRIAEIGPAGQTTVPAGAQRVDASGKFMIPSLAEMHAHVFLSHVDAISDAGVERMLGLWVANGVGTVRGIRGSPRWLAIRDRAARGELVSPIIVLGGPMLSGHMPFANDVCRPVTGSPEDSAPTQDPCPPLTAESAARRVREIKAAGYDFMKFHTPPISLEAFDAGAATAHEVGMPITGHVPAPVTLDRALKAKYSVIDHADGYAEALAGPEAPRSDYFFEAVNLVPYIDESKLPALVKATKDAGTWVIPTERLVEDAVSTEDPLVMAKRPELRYVPPEKIPQWIADKRAFGNAVSGSRPSEASGQQKPWPVEDRHKFIAFRRRLIKALHDGGVGLMLGSESPTRWSVPGFSLHRELALMVASGLTPYQALATGTRNVATYLGTLDRTGTLEAGKRADLVLLDANPLENIANSTKIAGVLIGGRWLPRAEIDAQLLSGGPIPMWP